MRKLRVRERSLPGVGELLELDTLSGQTVTIIVRRSGGREIGLRRRGDETAAATAPLTAAESIALAGLLTGARISLTTEDDA